MSAPDNTRVDVETWARDVIRAAKSRGSLPIYGSADWSYADQEQRWAAAVVSAEVRRHEGTTAAIAEGLAYELWLHRIKDLEDQDFAARAAAWKRQWIPSLPGFRSDPAAEHRILAEWRDWVAGLHVAAGHNRAGDHAT